MTKRSRRGQARPDDPPPTDPHEASAALIQTLAAGIDAAPILLLCLHRSPEASESIRPELDAVRSYAHLALDELSPEVVRRLASSQLGGELPLDILYMIEERAQGSPFFVKDLAETLQGTRTRRQPGRKVDHLLRYAGLPQCRRSR